MPGILSKKPGRSPGKEQLTYMKERQEREGISMGNTTAEEGKEGYVPQGLESHNAEQTPDCQEEILIPKIPYQGEDRKLKERVSKFKEGSLRIASFTVLGLFMGYYSHTYVTDHFLPTKAILAVPYKLMEAVYVSVLGTDAPARYAGRTLHIWLTEFFPHSILATFVAEVVTTILMGGAIYGSLAYFTGDKRVFTLGRYLKFAGCWCALILLCIGAAYGINAKAVADNEHLRGEPVFWLRQKDGSSLGGNRAVQDALKESLHRELEPVTLQRTGEEEIPLEISFGEMRYGLYWVNCKDCYLATEGGRTYRVSREFARIVWDFYEKGELPAEADGQEEGEMWVPVSETDPPGESGKTSGRMWQGREELDGYPVCGKGRYVAGLMCVSAGVPDGDAAPGNKRRSCGNILQNRDRQAKMGGVV